MRGAERRWWRIGVTGLVVMVGLLAGPHASAAPARFTFGLRDAAAKAYELTIAARDERVSVVGQDEAYGAYSFGDRKAEGTYRAWLRAKAAGGTAKLQAVSLFEPPNGTHQGEFNLERDMVYVMRGAKGQPDLLVVLSYAWSGGDDACVFCVRGGQLTPVRTGTGARDAISTGRAMPFRLHAVGPCRFRSSAYDNSVGQWHISDWRLDTKQLRLVCTRARHIDRLDPNLEALSR